MKPITTTGQSLSLVLMLLLALGLNAPAQASSPHALLEQAAREMFTALEQGREQLQNDPQYVFAVVNELLVPHVDMHSASRWALGPHWREASPAQQARFVSEFRNLLVRFYSTALAEYAHTHQIPEDIITFLPARAPAGETDTTVRTVVRQGNGRPIHVNYDVHLTPEGWKVYDVWVDGVSMVSVYRSVFESEIRRAGMEGLLAHLTARNGRVVHASLSR